jgi:hypothetical protein
MTEKSTSSLVDGVEKFLEESISSMSTLTPPVNSVGRRAPEQRGEIRKTRSLLVEMEIPSTATSSPQSSSEEIGPNCLSPCPVTRRKSGTLTYANSVSELRRAGASRDGCPATPKPTRRQPPPRLESPLTG